MLSIVYNDFLIFDNVIRITLKVPLLSILLSIGSRNGKNRLFEGHSRFLSILPFLNHRNESIGEALMSHKIVYSINEEKILLLEKNTHFSGKNQFSEIHEYLLIF